MGCIGAWWHRAQHGAEWPEEGLVLPRRPARVPRRRRGEVVPTGTRATVGGSAEGDVSTRVPAADCRVVEVPKISCHEKIEALKCVSHKRISEEQFEVLEKDSAQIGVPRERVQQRSAEKDIVKIFENIPEERISDRT